MKEIEHTTDNTPNEMIGFKHCIVKIWDKNQYLETIFDDLTKVPAAPNHDPESEARAKELGYTNTWEMSREHEILHTVLAEAAGYPWSPTLHSVAHGYKLPLGAIKMEESLVLCVQKMLNDAREKAREKGLQSSLK